MISPYELAFLCDHAYRSDPQILPSSYAINIEGAAQWGVGAHDGVSDSFFCTKYIKTGTFENVIAFRGTGGRVADIAVDASHLLVRYSPYLNAARSFLSRYATRDTIVTGHSLGGYIAISMAFNRPIKVVAINPPWMGGVLAAAADQIQASTSTSFQRSRIIVYQSNTDVVTGYTHQYRIHSSNLRFIRIGAVGFHGLGPVIEDFKRNRRYAVTW
jgi:pimeloyl-ACP methyl ester carboxylesterase